MTERPLRRIVIGEKREEQRLASKPGLKTFTEIPTELIDPDSEIVVDESLNSFMRCVAIMAIRIDDHPDDLAYFLTASFDQLRVPPRLQQEMFTRGIESSEGYRFLHSNLKKSLPSFVEVPSELINRAAAIMTRALEIVERREGYKCWRGQKDE